MGVGISMGLLIIIKMGFFFEMEVTIYRRHCRYFDVISIYRRYCPIFFDFSLNRLSIPDIVLESTDI